MTPIQARDAAFGLLLTKWATDTPAVNGGTAPPILWPGVTYDEQDPTVARAEVFWQPGQSKQGTFGGTGERRFNRKGLMTVMVLYPLSLGGGLTKCEQLAIIARDALEGIGTADGLWFRNSRVNDVGPNGEHYQMNVVVEFYYDETR